MRFTFVLLALLLFCSPVAAQVVGQEAPSTGSVTETPAEANDVKTSTEVLIKVLEDPKKREALIRELKGAETPAGTAEPSGDEASPVSDEVATGTDEPITTVLAQYSSAVMADVNASLEKAAHTLSGLSRLFKGEIKINADRAIDSALNVLYILVSVTIIYWLCQKVFMRFSSRISAKYARRSWLFRSVVLILLSALDALTVFLACIVSVVLYLVPFLIFDQEDYLVDAALDAFWTVGLARVALRFVFAPARPELRLMPFGNDYSNYWYSKLYQLSVFVGFGLLLVVPYVNIVTSFVIGNALRFALLFVATLMLVGLIYQQREWVAKGIRSYAKHMTNSLVQQTVASLGVVWHWLAMTYVASIFMLWFTRPIDAVEIAVRSTGLSILAIMVGFLISLAITKPIKSGIRLPDTYKRRLPELEGRINAFLPGILRMLRFVVFIFTVLVLLDVWGITSFTVWLASTEGSAAFGRGLSALIVLAVSFLVWLAVMAWIDLRLRVRSGHVVTARERTLFQLFRNAFTMVVLVMATLLALSEVGINIGPLIAGAGVVGLAISFGAQTLVKDVITGAFIQIENAINEGDVVTVAGITGTVERLTVRSVRIRDINGTAHIIPFSSVDMVANFMRDFSYHVAEIGVAYDTDIGKAKAAMEEAFRRLRESDAGSKIIGDLEMHGVTMFGDSAINVRARVKTLPGEQFSLGRAYNEFIKAVFDEEGIEIPFPQVTYHMPAASVGKKSLPMDEPANDAGGSSSPKTD
ncbi:mechanosensitive ion channel domain-containing protein [Roseibium sediminis]|uniref:mechanosensitive ion channel domain-containing protein n=1 Tax=Roseibium sediminis TaxID=1775174 RepID=UPI00123C7D72|nr:mechanosensitive ion channel domain-containing protein [Roseibium sediminis]